MRQEIWLSDLTQCEPADAIAYDGRYGTWLAVDYEVNMGKGVMLRSSVIDCTRVAMRLGESSKYPPTKKIEKTYHLLKPLHRRPQAAITSIFILGKIKMDISFSHTTKDRPPWSEDRPFCFGTIAMNTIFHIAFTMADCAMIIDLIEQIVTTPAVGIYPAARSDMLQCRVQQGLTSRIWKHLDDYPTTQAQIRGRSFR